MNPDPLFDVRDRLLIVTGGLGQLGRSFVGLLHARGARVAVLDRDAPDSARAAALPPGCLYRQVDLTDKAALQTVGDALVAAHGPPHGLVNNAAIDSPPGAPAAENGPFESYPESSWDRVMTVNVKGVFLCCQTFGGAMAAAGRGSIVNISSIYGLVSPNQTLYEYRRQRGEDFYKPVAYAASKSALFNLTRYLATYWAARGVRVNTLTFAGVANRQDPQFLEGYCRQMPMGRMAEPEDYHGPLLYLLADASRYMTGSNMVVDGGWTAW